MQIAIFSYSDNGCQLALRIATFYRAQGHVAACHAIAKFAEKYQLRAVPSTAQGVKDCFATVDMLVFVGACGIAVRAIAPLLQSKTQDPACLVVDDAAQFVIPLVSGHIGGANEQACVLAAALGAMPVVTTATDVNHRFAVDTFATKQGFAIESMAKVKEFSAQILRGDLPIITCPEIVIATPLPGGLCLVAEAPESMALYIGYRTDNASPQTLRLTPKVLTLGIGCKKNTPQQNIEALVQQVLAEASIDPAAVRGVASIDLKATEAGLLQFCAAHGYQLQTFSAQQLQAVEGDFTPSRFVQSVTGVDNVCERAAFFAAQQTGSRAQIICRKTSCNGVTVAIVSQEMEVRFA